MNKLIEATEDTQKQKNLGECRQAGHPPPPILSHTQLLAFIYGKSKVEVCLESGTSPKCYHLCSLPIIIIS